MIVISQDKMHITENIDFKITSNETKFIDVEGVVVETIPATEIYIKSPHGLFGIYSSFKRAGEVLQDLLTSQKMNDSDFYFPKE